MSVEQPEEERVYAGQPYKGLDKSKEMGVPVFDAIPPMKYPDGNPKTAFGVKKPPMWYVPMPAIFMTALAHLQGALKYGHFNWRQSPVSASTYINAAIRHIAEWKEGGETASDSGIHHLAHAGACLNIIMDAQRYGTLIDDRHECKTDFDALFKELEPLINRIQTEWGPK